MALFRDSEAVLDGDTLVRRNIPADISLERVGGALWEIIANCKSAYFVSRSRPSRARQVSMTGLQSNPKTLQAESYPIIQT